MRSTSAVVLPGTAAGRETAADEQNAAVDEDANISNANAADKPSSPSVKSQHADNSSTAAEGQYSIEIQKSKI